MTENATPATPLPPVEIQMLGAQTLVLAGIMEILLQKRVASQEEMLAMLDWCKENARGQEATESLIEVFRGGILARRPNANDA